MRLLIGAWLFCLMGYILTGCVKKIEIPEVKFNDRFKVQIGFYKDCIGYSTNVMFQNTNQQEILLTQLKCVNKNTGDAFYAPDTWFKMNMVGKL